MLHHLHSALPLLKRGEVPPPNLSEVPKWLWALFAVDLIVFLPVFLIVGYTLGSILPTLAIVEDEKAAPAYEALATRDPEDTEADPSGPSAADPDLFNVNSSLRRLHRLLRRASGGWRTYFRGLMCVLAIALATGVAEPAVRAALGLLNLHPLATFVVYLALAQLHTAWVHIVITPRSPVHFFRRLPPFGKAFRANLRPTALFAATALVSQNVPALLAELLGEPYPTRPWTGRPDPTFPDSPSRFPVLGLLFLLHLALAFFLVLPAYAAVIRVQASLLPPDQDPIVAFDRSFGGRVDPAVVASENGGRDYATLRDVWETVTRAALRRFALVMLKIVGVNLALGGILAAVLAPQIHQIPRSDPGGSAL